MITVTRLNGETITLNADLIESIETRPDTLITLTTGNKIMVKEKVSEITDKVVEYKRKINFIGREDIRQIIQEEQE